MTHKCTVKTWPTVGGLLHFITFALKITSLVYYRMMLRRNRHSFVSQFVNCSPSSPGLSTDRVHLHRDHHDVRTLRRRLLFRVCQLQCLRRDGSPPAHLLPQPAHQGAPHQLEPNGRYRETQRSMRVVTRGQRLEDVSAEKTHHIRWGAGTRCVNAQAHSRLWNVFLQFTSSPLRKATWEEIWSHRSSYKHMCSMSLDQLESLHRVFRAAQH